MNPHIKVGARIRLPFWRQDERCLVTAVGSQTMFLGIPEDPQGVQPEFHYYDGADWLPWEEPVVLPQPGEIWHHKWHTRLVEIGGVKDDLGPMYPEPVVIYRRLTNQRDLHAVELSEFLASHTKEN